MELLYPRADGPARVSKVDERGLFPLRIPRVHRLRSPGAACILRNVADRYLHLCRFGCQSQETDKEHLLRLGAGHGPAGEDHPDAVDLQVQAG